ncbi:hypothetical protein Tco_0089053 [Tanacetum coccineum]
MVQISFPVGLIFEETDNKFSAKVSVRFSWWRAVHCVITKYLQRVFPRSFTKPAGSWSLSPVDLRRLSFGFHVMCVLGLVVRLLSDSLLAFLSTVGYVTSLFGLVCKTVVIRQVAPFGFQICFSLFRLPERWGFESRLVQLENRFTPVEGCCLGVSVCVTLKKFLAFECNVLALFTYYKRDNLAVSAEACYVNIGGLTILASSSTISPCRF